MEESMRPDLERLSLDKLKDYKDYLITEGAHAPYHEPRTKKGKGEQPINFTQQYYTSELQRVDRMITRRTREAIEEVEAQKAWEYLHPGAKYSKSSKIKSRIKTYFITLLTKGYR